MSIKFQQLPVLSAIQTFDGLPACTRLEASKDGPQVGHRLKEFKAQNFTIVEWMAQNGRKCLSNFSNRLCYQ